MPCCRSFFAVDVPGNDSYGVEREEKTTVLRVVFLYKQVPTRRAFTSYVRRIVARVMLISIIVAVVLGLAAAGGPNTLDVLMPDAVANHVSR